MKPRIPTQEDCEFWGADSRIIPMRGDHVGAANIKVIRTSDGTIKVPWVVDERDNIEGLREGFTVWTTFWGGMLPTDAVVV